jgi:1,4-dihydroxy-2-naphthoate octaprenyltransferase
MKDLVISGKRVKTELLIALGCFICAVLINIICIIVYHSQWHEIFSQIGFTVFVAVILYVLLLIVRLIVLACRKIFSKRTK